MNHLHYERLIITPNHVSFLDGILLGVFLPIRPVFAIYSGYINHWLIRLGAHFIDFVPLDPTNAIAIKKLVREVEKGRPIVIFPEGRITITGSLMKIYDGSAFIAAKSAATVIPVWIDGAEFSLLSRLKGIFKQRLFPRITIHLLPPTKITEPDLPSSSEKRYAMGEKLHTVMMNARIESHQPSSTLFESLLAAQIRYGSSTPIIKDTLYKEQRYRQFIRHVIGIGRLLAKHTEAKERIGILLPNSVIAAATIFGLSYKQRIPCLLNYTADRQGLKNATIAADIKVIITSRQFLEKSKLDALPDAMPDVRWVFLEEVNRDVTLKDKIWTVLHAAIPRLINYNQKVNDEAIVLFTSGSEGAPKGVVHSHASLLANIEQIRTVLDPMSQDRFMSTLPLFHAFGLTGGLLLPLMSGSRVLLYPNPLHYRQVPEIIYDQNCSILFGTPTFLNQYATFAHPFDFMRLRYVVAGAEKLSDDVRQLWMDKFGIRLLDGYGVTECAPAIAINVPMAFKKGTVGRILPGMTARILPVEGIEKGGILQVKGPNVMKGYLKVEYPGKIEKPSASNAAGEVEQGWYDTGDIVDIDKEGFCTILGRFKRFAKIAGEMISLETVENLAKVTEPDAKHATIIKRDHTKGESIILFTTSKGLRREQLTQKAQQLGIPTLAVPRDIRQVDELPLLGSGKVNYIALQQIVKET